MLLFVLRRALLSLPLLVGITLVSFIVIHLAPGEPTELQQGDLSAQGSAEVRALLRQ